MKKKRQWKQIYDEKEEKELRDKIIKWLRDEKE